MGGKSGPSGTTTSTSNTEPWGPQQPYLQDIFTNARNLYQNNAPQYYPNQTYAPLGDQGQQALQNISNAGLNGSPVVPSSINTLNSFLSGTMSSYDPAIPILNTIAGQGQPPAQDALQPYLSGANLVNPYAGSITSILSGNQNPYTNVLSPYLSGGPQTNPYSSNLSPLLANQPNPYAGYYDQFLSGDQTNPYVSSLNPYLSGQSTTPSTSALQPFLSGQRAQAGNPYTQQLINSISSSVTPQIQSQFIQGGALSSPEAARATAAGLGSALAAPLFQQAQQEEQNTIAAQGQSAQQQLAAQQQRLAAQEQAAQQYQTGVGNRFAAIQGGGGMYQTGLQNLLNAAGLGGSMYNQAVQNQLTAQQAAAGQYQTGLQNQLTAQQQLAGQYNNAAVNQLAAQSAAAQQELGTRQQQLQAGTQLQNAFGQNTQQMLSALGLAPTIQQMPYTDLSQAYGANVTQQQLTQQAINDAVARWNYGQTLPFQRLNQYIGEVTGNYGGTTTATQPYFNNQTGNSIGLLGALGSIGSGLFGSGGLLGLFSDRRMKEDIKQIDTLDNGLPLYAFRYIGEPMIHIGVMADEVERIHPEAVFVGIGGFAMVDYARAVI